MKITTADGSATPRAGDVCAAAASQDAIGIGYDLHRLVAGRPLMLGGVAVPFELGALGHSDADVVCHAVTDAILGAASAGDIGQHFPDTDAAWKDASSIDLLRQVVALVRERGWTVVNVDVVVMLERPKLGPHRDAMRAALAGALGIDPRAVSVKAKTNEGVDAVGRGEAIAAHASCALTLLQATSRLTAAMRLRVRFAPSPTGQLHVGNARTALFNWLLAHGKDGTFVLRIEDTDAERSTRESETSILEDLRWLGLEWDEGPDVGGPHGPYRQSERLHLYASYANELLGGGHAYYCFCSPAELEADRQADLAAGLPPKYHGTLPRTSRRSRRAARSRRAKRPSCASAFRRRRDVTFDDLVRGDVTFNTDVIGDPVLVRSDGRPAYNFAVVVDDALMEITHVIRGEDHISNTPRQVLLYQALGFTPPAVRAPVAGAWARITRRCRSVTARRRWRSSARAATCRRRWSTTWRSSAGRRAEDEELLPLDELARRFAIEDVGHSAGVFDHGEARVGEPPLHEGGGAGAAGRASRCATSLRARIREAADATRRSSTSRRCFRWPSGSVDRLEEIPDRVRFLFEFDAAAALRRDRGRASVLREPAARERDRGAGARSCATRRASIATLSRGGQSREAATGQKGRRCSIRSAWRSPARRPVPSWIWPCRRSIAAPSCRRRPGSRRSSAAASAPRRSRGAIAQGRQRQPSRAMIVYGINPVLEALRARARAAVCRRGAAPDRARSSEVARRSRARACACAGRARGRAGARARMARGGVASGRCRRSSRPAAATTALEELVARQRPSRRCSSCSTAIEDPHNVGAILRTADAAGAHGVVRQARHAAPLDGRGARRRPGAVAHVRVATVVNIARAIEELKDAGCLDGGLDGGCADASYDEVGPDAARPRWCSAPRAPACGGWCASGATGSCAIPMAAPVESLNVSVAAGVVLFEAVRQRTEAGRDAGGQAGLVRLSGP